MFSEGARPPVEVVRAFGASAGTTPQPLAGNLQQSAWRIGDLVLKPVEEPNPGEGSWVADVLDAMVEDGFRVIRPVRARSGAWLVDRWAAWRWLDGGHVRTDWPAVLPAADAFHRELRAAVLRLGLDERPRWLDSRNHRWARAERTVWHGAALPPTVNEGDDEWAMFRRAVALGPPLTESETTQCQVVHGDIAGNVLVDASGTFGFIDMSPGWRPPSSTTAQTIVEAVAWFGAEPALLATVPAADAARACAFRLLCGLQSLTDWAATIPDEVAAWRGILDAIGA